MDPAVGLNFVSQKAQHVGAAKVFDALMDQRWIKPSQRGGAFEHHVGGVFAFAHTPVVGQGQRSAQFGRVGMALRDQRLEQRGPSALELRTGQRLGARHVFKPGETVFALDVTQAGLIELAGQPMPAIEAKIYGEGKPGLQPQMQQSQFFVQEIKVVVQAFARLQPQHEFLLRALAAHEVSQARLDHAPDADQSADQSVAPDLVAGQQFLALGTAVQIKQRPARALGQLLSGEAHAFGPSAGEGRKVLEQDAHTTQVSHHETGLVERAQGGHETEAVKTRDNADDIAGVLSYKGGRDVVRCGSNFDFHTNVLSHRRRPVCSSLWLRRQPR